MAPDQEGALYRTFALRFPTEDACLEHLLKLRLGNPGTCPKCLREGRFHRLRQQQAYICQWCAYHIHPKAGTPFARSRVPLQDWFYVMFLINVGHRRMTAAEVQRQLGITYKAAWRMTSQIRAYL